ncbi:MAG TPA: YlxR family protein [Candidatus Anaerofilum faecale]|nr:YlxR family protein [Candidatus Anaerofilum faecale]
MQPKKIPVRRCSGCGESKPKKELVRVVRNAAGEISLDPIGKKPGRGAYLCPSPACLAKARKAKRLERSFGCAVPDEVYAQLEEQLKEETPDA